MTALPAYIDPEMWAAFIESRQAMKVPFTQRAQLLVIKRLMAFHGDGWCPNASLEKSAIYGYRGVFQVERLPQKSAVSATQQMLDNQFKGTTPPNEATRAKLAELRKPKERTYDK